MRLFSRKPATEPRRESPADRLRDLIADWDRSIEDARARGGERFERTAIDPATLAHKAWSPHDTTSTYCYCGHERAAHVTSNYYDGTCVVDGCTICKSSGYAPGVPVHSSSNETPPEP